MTDESLSKINWKFGKNVMIKQSPSVTFCRLNWRLSNVWVCLWGGHVGDDKVFDLTLLCSDLCDLSFSLFFPSVWIVAHIFGKGALEVSVHLVDARRNN